MQNPAFAEAMAGKALEYFGSIKQFSYEVYWAKQRAGVRGMASSESAT